MIVYVDVLITLNFVVDYLLLVLSARMCGGRVRRVRTLLAAAIGGVSSLIIFLPPQSGAENVLIKLALSLLLAAVAGGYETAAGYIKRAFTLLVASFLFAGFMLFITLLSGGETSFFYNGVCYFHISALSLLCCSVAAYAAITLYRRIFKKSMVGRESYTVLLRVGEKTERLPGVTDSQNNLVDVFTGTPVVVGSEALLSHIAPDAVKAALAALAAGVGDECFLSGVRLIPCSTVAGEGMLAGFRPDEFILVSPDGARRAVGDVYVAIAPNGDGKELLLNPALTGELLKQ